MYGITLLFYISLELRGKNINYIKTTLSMGTVIYSTQ